ncbi:SymE family type I addiction module toxin [Flavobacterium ginsengiterrae]|uniref:Toxin SymE-like domain-containing protein n=1 Tax=Flavobacterium ginsengiterrae TaxID=871695 RepID=A0ABP7H3X1_9FLAO
MKQENITQQSAKRRLKIQPKYMARSYHRYVIFPEIRLCGKWLQEIGFNCGNFVTVEHQRNKIIITTQKEIQTK